MGEKQTVQMVYNLAIALANSGLSDRDLLYIADAVYAAEQPDNQVAKDMFARHGKSPFDKTMSGHLMAACRQRNIDVDTGTKAVTSTIDLLV